MDYKNETIENLLNEVEKIQQEIDRKKHSGNPKPKIIKKRIFSELRDIVEEYIDFIWSDDYHEDNNYKDYIFEAAIETFYGDIWEKINRKI